MSQPNKQCVISPFSSRCCELGTKACNVNHTIAQFNEPIYQSLIVGQGWFDVAKDDLEYVDESYKRTLYKSPPTAQPNEPVRHISEFGMRTDENDGEDVVVSAPQNLEEANKLLEAKVKELRGLLMACVNQLAKQGVKVSYKGAPLRDYIDKI